MNVIRRSTLGYISVLELASVALKSVGMPSGAANFLANDSERLQLQDVPSDDCVERILDLQPMPLLDCSNLS